MRAMGFRNDRQVAVARGGNGLAGDVRIEFDNGEASRILPLLDLLIADHDMDRGIETFRAVAILDT